MGWGWLKKGLKEGLGAIGDVAKYAAPALALTGVGAPVAGLIGAGGGALGKLNDDDASWGGALTEGAKYGALGYGAGKARDYFKGGGGDGTRPDRAGVFADFAKGAAGGGGGGMDLRDWLTLGTAGAGALAGGYGAYQEGKMADAQLAEDTRRYNQDFGEGQRRYNEQFGFEQKQYGDERADIDWDRERRRRSGVAINPLVAGLLRKQAVQMGS